MGNERAGGGVLNGWETREMGRNLCKNALYIIFCNQKKRLREEAREKGAGAENARYGK